MSTTGFEVGNDVGCIVGLEVGRFVSDGRLVGVFSLILGWFVGCIGFVVGFVVGCFVG